MKNVWLDELLIKSVVVKLALALTKKYGGHQPILQDWGVDTMEFLKHYKKHIQDAIVWRYTYDYNVDPDGNVIAIRVVKLPHII